MRRAWANAIEEWFANHDGDGEFSAAERSNPYMVIGPRSDTASIVITTKPTVLRAAAELQSGTSRLSIIGRYGLPDEDDLRWIRRIAATRKLLFLGDMDPPDLLVFAWLRESLRPKSIKYAGAGDRLLNLLGISQPDRLAMPLATSEKNSLELLRRTLADLDEIVGPQSSRLLHHGYKIELEAIMTASQNDAAALSSALESLASPDYS